jgi:hypothetical protein
MPSYVLEPEVAGGWGISTVADTSTYPPHVSALEYRFDGWLGDELLESFTCYIVTARVAHALRLSALSGFVLRPVRITRSSEFEEFKPGFVFPDFEWLDIVGKAGLTDFGRDSNHRLVVSETARSLLKGFDIDHCQVQTWDA